MRFSGSSSLRRSAVETEYWTQHTASRDGDKGHPTGHAPAFLGRIWAQNACEFLPHCTYNVPTANLLGVLIAEKLPKRLFSLVPLGRIELPTSSLPMTRSTTELQRRPGSAPGRRESGLLDRLFPEGKPQPARVRPKGWPRQTPQALRRPKMSAPRVNVPSGG